MDAGLARAWLRATQQEGSGGPSHVCDKVLPMFHPNGRFRAWWNFAMAMLISYSGIAVPMQLAFYEDWNRVGWITVDYLVDFVFMVRAPKPQTQPRAAACSHVRGPQPPLAAPSAPTLSLPSMHLTPRAKRSGDRADAVRSNCVARPSFADRHRRQLRPRDWRPLHGRPYLAARHYLRGGFPSTLQAHSLNLIESSASSGVAAMRRRVRLAAQWLLRLLRLFKLARMFRLARYMKDLELIYTRHPYSSWHDGAFATFRLRR